MSVRKEPKIVISKDGPYIVYGDIPLSLETIAVDAEGGSWEWEHGRSFPITDAYALCRCGQSGNKPFCDGTHAKIGFDGTETAARVPHVEQADVLDGPTMVLEDATVLCAYARFCDVAGTIWKLIGETDQPNAREMVAREEMHCPSGRLVVLDKTTGKRIEPELATAIGLVEDPAQNCSGPLWAQGGIPVESADGTTYEARNRVTLCRCGASKNKPFCDGSHADPPWLDGLS
jgi:CDGSH-type Zn-finger protein